MERYGNTVPHLRYPKRNFRLAETGDDLRLAIPAYLAVELYRTGILPRDADIPVKIRIDGRPAASFTLRAVYYPDRTDGPFPAVNFTFTRVWEEHRRRAARLVETLGETTAEEQQQLRAARKRATAQSCRRPNRLMTTTRNRSRRPSRVCSARGSPWTSKSIPH